MIWAASPIPPPQLSTLRRSLETLSLWSGTTSPRTVTSLHSWKRSASWTACSKTRKRSLHEGSGRGGGITSIWAHTGAALTFHNDRTGWTRPHKQKTRTGLSTCSKKQHSLYELTLAPVYLSRCLLTCGSSLVLTPILTTTVATTMRLGTLSRRHTKTRVLLLLPHSSQACWGVHSGS